MRGSGLGNMEQIGSRMLVGNFPFVAYVHVWLSCYLVFSSSPSRYFFLFNSRLSLTRDAHILSTTALLSPDAYIQMALQLAWYKTRGEFTATYETALTRMFAKGRTETIRTFTSDSRAWVLSMVDPRSSVRAVCFARPLRLLS